MFSGKDNNFKDDFGYANKLTKQLLPELNNHLSNGKCVQTEHLKGKVAKLLDSKAKIDGLYLADNTDIGGIALRTQNHSDKNWGTFTIRHTRSTGYKSYNKMKRMIFESESFYPHYTCQSYFGKDEKLLGGAFCFTKDLFLIASDYEPFKNRKEVYMQKNYNDGNTFIVVPFDIFKRYKYPILKF